MSQCGLGELRWGWGMCGSEGSQRGMGRDEGLGGTIWFGEGDCVGCECGVGYG